MSTKIEWCDETLNPVIGCSKVSPACKNCYAEKIAYRFKDTVPHYSGTVDENGWTGRIGTNLECLKKLEQWRTTKIVFVVSMGDLFHENVPTETIRNVFDMCTSHKASRAGHRILFLTKRPQRAYEEFGGVPLGCSLGVTVENQEMAEERIPWLEKCGADIKFISAEPLLGPVDLSPWEGSLDWVIAGGETGSGARPMHPRWVTDIKDFCAKTNVPFFFKKWGEWIAKPITHHLNEEGNWIWNGAPLNYNQFGCLDVQGNYFESTSTWNGRQLDERDDFEVSVYRVGKEAAGRTLAGKEWNQFPWR